MAFSNRLYNNGEKGHFIYDQYKGSHKFNKYFYLRMGVIEEVDLDKYEMTVRWADDTGVRNRVPISFAFASPAGCLGALPEKGSIGIFGFYNEGGGKGSPLLLSYLPSGLDAGLNFNAVKVLPDALSTDDINVVNFKFRKLGPGDMIMSSSLGGSVFLNKNVEIRDGMQDSILIREDDQLIIATSLNNFIFANGAAVSAGPAIRNGLVVYDQDGNKLPGNGSILTLSSGKDNVYIVPHGDPIQFGTKYYAEYRIDVDELGDGKIDLNDINSSSPLSVRDPIVTQVLGNYIGADRFNHQTYGNILKARLFTSHNDVKGGFGLEKAMQNNGVDEPSLTGLAYALHFLKSDCFMGVDKEGHYYMNLPASKTNPLGAGRSMSLLAAGNLKEIWGQTVKENNSWDLYAKGGIRWNVGAHNSSLSGLSINIVTTKGINIDVGGADDNGYAKTETLIGNVQETVVGNKDASVKNLNLFISGLKNEDVFGSSSETVTSNKTVNVLGTYSETAVKDKQEFFGGRSTTIAALGSSTLKVLLGSISETIVGPGIKSTLVNTGAINETIGTGSRATTIGTGSYSVTVAAGPISIQTPAGLVSITGTTVSVNGSTVASINAPLVMLGGNPVKGGVVTGLPGVPTHFDYVVGIPLMGSAGVYA